MRDWSRGAGADDRSLIAREPGLPGLSLVLDDAAFGEALAAALPEAGIVAVRGEYVRYKPGTSCLVGYVALTGDGRRTHVYARAHLPDDPEKLRSGRRAAARDSQLGPSGAVFGDELVAVHVFPADRRLRSLRRVVRAKDVLTLRYKPERRWVGRVGGRVVRVYAPDAFLPAARAALAFAGAGDLPVPGRVVIDERRDAVMTAWVPGVTLDERLATAAAPDGARLAGGALAALHRARIPGLAPAPDPVGTTLDAARAVGALLPCLAMRAAETSARLVQKLENGPVPVAPVHGDFSADQAVLGPTGAVLLDLDAAALGDPLADLASFAAELELRVATGELGAATARTTHEALLDGYRAAGGTTSARGPRMPLATARALLQRATDPFRTRHPGWAESVERVVERAAELERQAEPVRPSIAARRRRG